MTQTNNKFFDEVAKATTTVVSAAEGVFGEVKEIAKNQSEKWVNDMELVHREEFDVLKEMVVNLTLDNKKLLARIEALEAGDNGKDGGK